MNTFFYLFKNKTHCMVRLLQIATLAIAVLLALPCNATDKREVKSRVVPVYPELAKRLKITGLVVVEATVDADGKVTAVKTISGNQMLAHAAEDAVHQWKFESGDGIATVQLEFRF